MAYRSRPSDADYVLRDVGQLVARFSQVSSQEPTHITDLESVASYSWLDAKTPTIIVPGSPPIWKGVNPRKVPLDTGKTFSDQNSARMGSGRSPLLPLFAAVDAFRGEGEYDYASLDLVTDRNGLRKLYRWATEVPKPHESSDFRIDLELAGDTCIFTRAEEQDIDNRVGARGFGAEYVKATTKAAPGCVGATGHHRIVSFWFGPLKILLRFSADACTGNQNEDSDLESLIAGISSLSTSSATPVSTSGTTTTIMHGVTVRKTLDELVPQSSLIEIKTRSMKRELDWFEIYPQLHLSQTPWLYLAKHDRGTFGTVEKHELASGALREYADIADDGIGKLRKVLENILSEVIRVGEGVPLSLVCINGKLALHRRTTGAEKRLGEDILARFKTE